MQFENIGNGVWEVFYDGDYTPTLRSYIFETLGSAIYEGESFTHTIEELEEIIRFMKTVENNAT